jgi:hypothetical protein
MKSIEMFTYDSLGTCKRVYKLYGWVLDFAFPTSFVFMTYALHIFFHFKPIKNAHATHPKS